MQHREKWNTEKCHAKLVSDDYQDLSREREKLNALWQKIDEWTSAIFCENDFGADWLGNVAGHSGIATWNDGFYTEDGPLSCRGSITDCSLDDDGLCIYTETAWVPMMQIWKRVCDKYLPGAEIVFDASEPGGELYQTNDAELIGKYSIDVLDTPPEEFEDVGSCPWADEEETIQFLQRVLETDEDDIDELLELERGRRLECDGEAWFTVGKWEYRDIDECE